MLRRFHRLRKEHAIHLCNLQIFCVTHLTMLNKNSSQPSGYELFFYPKQIIFLSKAEHRQHYPAT